MSSREVGGPGSGGGSGGLEPGGGSASSSGSSGVSRSDRPVRRGSSSYKATGRPSQQRSAFDPRIDKVEETRGRILSDPTGTRGGNLRTRKVVPDLPSHQQSIARRLKEHFGVSEQDRVKVLAAEAQQLKTYTDPELLSQKLTGTYDCLEAIAALAEVMESQAISMIELEKTVENAQSNPNQDLIAAYDEDVKLHKRSQKTYDDTTKYERLENSNIPIKPSSNVYKEVFENAISICICLCDLNKTLAVGSNLHNYSSNASRLIDQTQMQLTAMNASESVDVTLCRQAPRYLHQLNKEIAANVKDFLTASYDKLTLVSNPRKATLDQLSDVLKGINPDAVPLGVLLKASNILGDILHVETMHLLLRDLSAYREINNRSGAAEPSHEQIEGEILAREGVLLPRITAYDAKIQQDLNELLVLLEKN